MSNTAEHGQSTGMRTVDPDEQLVARAIGHDHAAYEQLAARHYAWVYRLCLARLRHRQDAEDATQEALIKSLRGLHRFQGRSRYRTWLASIVERECVDTARRRARHVLTPELTAALAIHQRQHAPECPSMESTLLPVRNAVATLPARHRNTIELRFYQGHRIDELAEVLGIGLSAAKMRLYRSLERLRARLKLGDVANAA